jgi:Ca2+-binding RTX toxin-like protein
MADISETVFTAANITGLSLNGGIIAGTFSGDIEVAGDRDWVRVQLVAGQQYQIFVSLDGPGGNSQLVLRDPAGNQILTDDDSGSGASSYTAFTPLVSGAYFIDVGESGNNEIGTYSVAVMNNTAVPRVLKFLDGASVNYDALADERVLGGAGNNVLDASTAGKDLFGEQGSDRIFGNALANVLSGGLGNDAVFGFAGQDLVFGDSGDDLLAGSEFAPGVLIPDATDTLIGGLGNDVYFSPQGDVIVERDGEGEDLVLTYSTVSLATFDFVENVFLLGTENANASGNALGNVLVGNDGNNILNGQAGADTLSGGLGNDIYYVDSAGDVTQELFNQGTDLVSSSVSRTLSAHIENLNLSGAANIDGNGNTGANRINGNAGNNILRGYEGADTLNGGGGNDILSGGTASDSINPGSDAVRDIIRFSAVADSTGSQRDIITGLDLTNEDRLDFTVVPTALAFVGGGALNLATINADLAAAVDGALAVNGAVLFDPTSGDMNVAGHLFVVVDANGDGIYKPNQDYVVQLVNSTGFLTLDDFI